MLLENYAVRAIGCLPDGGLTGRKKITTAYKTVTAENVVEVLQDSLSTHSVNAGEIDYLYSYYRGKQDIRNKTKQTRENINNKVTVNRANEIVTFKTAYLLSAPIQYSDATGSEATSREISRLNEYMRAEDKESKDKEIVDWLHICGVAPRLVLDDKEMDEEDGAPFCLYTLDPRYAYNIYHNGIGGKRVAGVILQQDEKNAWFADVYTPDRHFIVKNGNVVMDVPTKYGGIPLIEYINNAARMGAFEPVISVLNGINNLESCAVDAVEDFVNGFDVFQNCEISNEQYGNLAIGGQAVRVKTIVQGMEAKVYRVASELSQSGVQSRIDDLTESYLTICGMPNRNGGSSTSDTGTATIYRDGWAEAESRATDSEKLIKRSEREMLKIVLRICDIKDSGKYALHLSLSDIKTDFLRKNLANMQSKVQVLCEMLANPYIHPLDAFATSGVFADSLEAYRRGMEWHEDQEAAEEEKLNKELENERINALRAGGQSDRDTEQANASEGDGNQEETSGRGI